MGILHDIGKAQSAFYEYITKNKNTHVVHSSAGGKYIDDYCETLKNSAPEQYKNMDLYKEIISYVIFAHHGLMDMINMMDSTDNYVKRLDYAVQDNVYDQEIIPYVKELEKLLINEGYEPIEVIIKKSCEEINVILESQYDLLNAVGDSKKEQKRKSSFYIGCLVRFILSFLKNADVNDSISVEQPQLITEINAAERNKFWKKSSDNIEKVYGTFKNANQSELSILRSQISDNAKKFSGENETGIYTLEVPTGGGKTLTVLRYALNNANTFHKDRIFYITAYLSVLEQNATEIKEVIHNDDYVLEHHSNIVKEENDNENEDDNPRFMWRQYLEDSWDSPIVLTTMVQFFNTLFKGKSNNLRRFNQLKNSIIIIDEIQSLPVKAVYNFNLIANFLKEVMNCNIVLCSATQPLLDDESLDYKINYGNNNKINKNIIDLTIEQQQLFDRVHFINSTFPA